MNPITLRKQLAVSKLNLFKMDTIKSKFYDIHFVNEFDEVFDEICQVHTKSKYCIVTDVNLAKLY